MLRNRDLNGNRYLTLNSHLIFKLFKQDSINCLHYRVASFNYGDSRARDAGPIC